MRSAASSRSVALLACWALAACELPEVTLPATEEVLVVQSVLRPDHPQQFVVVERSLTGATEAGQTGRQIPPSAPDLPMTGATVILSNESFPEDPCGSEVLFDRAPVSPDLTAASGVYWGPVGCPTLRSGDRIRLRVETGDGRVVRGATVVPWFEETTFRVRGEVVAPGEAASFNRDRDTIAVEVSGGAFRALQLEAVRLGRPWDVSLRTFSTTSDLTVAGNHREVFSGGIAENAFFGGRSYEVLVGVSDTNFYDFARSRGHPWTGRGFLNHLEGGVGVFGSLVAFSHFLHVEADQTDEREGRYRLQGTLGGVPVDIELDLYLGDPAAEGRAFSAFLSGTWIRRVATLLGATWVMEPIDLASVDGRFDGADFRATIPTRHVSIAGEGPLLEVTMRGTQSDTFSVTVEMLEGISPTLLGTLAAERL